MKSRRSKKKEHDLEVKRVERCFVDLGWIKDKREGVHAREECMEHHKRGRRD